MNMADILISCTSARSFWFGTRFNSKVTPFQKKNHTFSYKLKEFLKYILTIYIFEILKIPTHLKILFHIDLG